MRILVTGGAGFIGSHICDRLLSLGQTVSVVDNLSTGKQHHVPEGVDFYEMDIRDPDLDKIFANHKPEIVIHQAAHANVTESVRNPLYNAEVNILGTLNLLECCVRHEVERIVFASTGGALYGEACYIPADEAHPVDPVSPYGVSKYAVEHYLYMYRQVHGLDYVTLRYPNVYGPRQDPHGEAGVVAIFALKLLKGEQPIIYGDGTKTRDYCYVSDIVDANILALNGPSGGIYNLGRGIEVSDLEIFETVRDAVGVDIEPIFAPVRPGEVNHIALDARKAERELGWRWKVDLVEGVNQTVQYYRQLINGETQ
ncbi:MAG: NAD-dependent epimerase/dehydratase family protein [Thermoleophilia bacterium]|nr:NAD-dependent epimerase/dehydratase family protein [Thermoleophilia bacterium]